MNNFQIDAILSSNPFTRKYYIGTFNIKTLPISVPHKVCLIVVNTEENVKVIGHWVAFYINNNKIIFFDSFAMLPHTTYGGNISKLLHSFSHRNVALTSRVQSLTSLVCGMHVIYFLHSISRKKTLIQITKNYSFSNRTKNDNFVTRYVFNLAGQRMMCSDFLCPKRDLNRKCERICTCKHFSKNNECNYTY